jgi:transcriptional regulator with XRE-family HTH domain
LEFDKQRFAYLLSQAKGDRSINRYGADSGVDPAYISRLLRGLIGRSPSAAIIRKLADNAYSGVTTPDLLTAAGYLNSEGYAHDDINYNHSMRMQEWEKVIEEAARYQISAEVAFELISSVGKSLEKIKK